jgi:alkylhydroperoxidase family enzyme
MTDVTVTNRRADSSANEDLTKLARHGADTTEAITRVADTTVADDFGARHTALAQHFSQEEILEIIGIVINMNVWTRLKLAEGASPGLGGQAMP